MKKRVKGGIEKHYCDKCGKNIYDHIPKEPTVKLFGQYIPEFGVKKHCDYGIKTTNPNRGEYCKECYDNLFPIKKKEEKKQKYTEIQNEVIAKYRIDLCDGTRCEDGDWDRTHAHVKKRRICKWKQKNSVQSTFDLLHEIGHIETTKSGMRRAEEEYFATVWAIEEAKKYGIEIPAKIIKDYQDYIDMEKARGLRRGGKAYAELQLI